jgi:gliding motility-associated-like protein
VPFTPASTQTYTVTGTSAAGCVNTSTVTVTVNPIPVVNAGLDVSICVGGSTTLTATGATTYSWAPGGQTTASITVSPTANTTYTVTGTSLGCVATDAVLVSILANAPINAGPDVAICAGQSTTLTATGGATYNWNNGLGAGASHSVSPAATTTYTVTGTDANGCIGTDGIVVTVNPNPSPVINGASEYCPGNFSVLSTTLPYNSYNWSTGSTSASINSTEANNPITVSVTNNFGCSGVSPAFTVSENNSITTNLSIVICQGESALIHGVNQTLSGLYSQTFVSSFGCDSISNVTLTVNPLPIVNAGNDVSVCFGESTVLNASGAVNYSWNNGGIQGSVAPTTTTTYTVTGTDANGCVNTDEITVTVNPIPNVNAGPDQTICIGASVTLSATGSADTYSWNNGVTNGVAFTPGVGTVTYTVTGSTIEGCVASDQVIVAVNPLPAVFAGNNVVVCEGESVTLTASGAASYSWNNGINNGISFVPSLGTTTYTVSGTSSAGCINTDQVDVTVNPNPEVAFIPGITLGCAPLETTFTNLTTDAVNCVWTFSNGTVITGCGTVPVTFSQSGCYDATLTTTSTNGCSSSFTATNVVCAEEAPNAAFTPSSNNVSNFNTLIDFTNQTTGASNYVWSFGDNSGISTEVNPSHLYPNDIEAEYMVTLIAYSPLGCVDTAYSFIQIYEELIFYVPNTFTPDIDNYNPVFQPVFTAGFDPYSYNLMIFNRWGEIVFESNNAEIGWNGSYGNNGQIEMCQDGVYTWKIEFKVSRWDERRQVFGHVNLIR